MDSKKIEQALKTLAESLPERPVWMILVNRDGEFIGHIGEYINTITSPRITNELAATNTYAHAMHELRMLNELNHGNFQFSVSIGASGAYFIFHLNDTYVLGVSYQRIGVRSIETIIEGVLDNFQELLAVLLYEAP